MQKSKARNKLSIKWLILGLLIMISGIVPAPLIRTLTIEVPESIAILLVVYGLMAMTAGMSLILCYFVTPEHGSSIVH